MIYSTDSLNVLQGLLFIYVSINILILNVSTNEVELRRSLFHRRSYDRMVCPKSGITEVHTNLILLQIESVDEKAQVLFLYKLISY